MNHLTRIEHEGNLTAMTMAAIALSLISANRSVLLGSALPTSHIVRNDTSRSTQYMLDIVSQLRHSILDNRSAAADQSQAGWPLEEGSLAPEEPQLPSFSWCMKLFWSLLFYPMIVLAAAGNLLIIWILATKPLMQSIMNRYLLNLAASDFLSITFNASFNFVFMLNEHWPFGSAYCVFNNFIANITLASSVCTIVLISLDRYYAIVHPLRPRQSHKRFLMSICVVWLFSVVFALPTLLFSGTATIDGGGGGGGGREEDELKTNHSSSRQHSHDAPLPPDSSRVICILMWPDGVQGFSQLDFIYNLAFFIVFYLIPLFILVVSLVLMFRVLWPGERIGEHTSLPQHALIRSKRRVLLMLVCVIGVFGVCWLPYQVYFLTAYWWPSIISHSGTKHIYLSFYWLAMANSLFNPIILFAMNRRIRNYILYYFKFTGCLMCYNGQQHLSHPRHYHGRRGPLGPTSPNLNNNHQAKRLTRQAAMRHGVNLMSDTLRAHKDSSLTEHSPTATGIVPGNTPTNRSAGNANANKHTTTQMHTMRYLNGTRAVANHHSHSSLEAESGSQSHLPARNTNAKKSRTFKFLFTPSRDEEEVEEEAEASDVFEASQYYSCPPVMCRAQSSQSSNSLTNFPSPQQNLALPLMGDNNILSYSERDLCSEYDCSSTHGAQQQLRASRALATTLTTSGTRPPSVGSQCTYESVSAHRLSGTFRFLFSQTKRFSTTQAKLHKHSQHYNCYQFDNKRLRGTTAGSRTSRPDAANRLPLTNDSVITTAL